VFDTNNAVFDSSHSRIAAAHISVSVGPNPKLSAISDAIVSTVSLTGSKTNSMVRFRGAPSNVTVSLVSVIITRNRTTFTPVDDEFGISFPVTSKPKSSPLKHVTEEDALAKSRQLKVESSES
jgi:hypothetical protein